jgi:hypothetical protein
VAKARPSLVAFNRGLISTSGLSRIDIARVQLSAEVQTNWMPRVLGSMTLRPGFQFIGTTKDNNKARKIPFVFATKDTAEIEVTENVARIWVDDALVTRPAVTAAVTNGNFDTDLTGWTDSDEAGATSSFAAGGFMSLVGTDTLSAIRDQEITVNEANIQHALRVIINRGSVTIKVGASQGDDIYGRAIISKGTHSLAFTPTGNFWIRLEADKTQASLVDSINVEAAGVLELPTPYQESDLPKIRYDQSGNTIFVACDVERISNASWSVEIYEPDDGPFLVQNLTTTTITPSATTGDITLTASRDLFKSGHVGGLFKVTQTGQSVTADISSPDTFTAANRVSGVGGGRIFTVSVTGIVDSTVTLQRSIGAPGDWTDVESYTVVTVKSFDDGLDNQIVFYRLGIKTGDYGTDTCTCLLSYSSGAQTGIARITAFTSETVVSASVLTAFGTTDASSDWQEGTWSTERGFPSSVSLHEGRLWWFGKDKIIGSISDAFNSFNEDFIGDAGPIQRSIGQGPVDTINWSLSLNRLLIGTENISTGIDAVKSDANSFLSVRSSSLDEPLTPTNFNIKSAAATAFYVDRSGQRVWNIQYGESGVDYQANEVTTTVPDLFEGGISQIALQQKPEQRLHCIKSDGTVGVLIFNIAENVICWIEIETDGVVEDISVLPGAGEDQVYYTVKRTINGSTVRYHEKWALESECIGGLVNKQADSFILYDGVSTTSLTGLSHLEGESVVVWGDGKSIGTYTVSSGAITVSPAVSKAVIGLGYQARYKTVKLAYGASNGTALLLKKRVTELGLILENTHYQGLQHGPSFDQLDELPNVEDAEEVPADKIWDQYDKEDFPFDGNWDTDSRIVLVANAPKPCTVLAMILTVHTSER